MAHSQEHHRPHPKGHAPNRAWWAQPHIDWRVWVAVGLMVAAMLAYILSFDESLQPAGDVRPAVPASP